MSFTMCYVLTRLGNSTGNECCSSPVRTWDGGHASASACTSLARCPYTRSHPVLDNVVWCTVLWSHLNQTRCGRTRSLALTICLPILISCRSCSEYCCSAMDNAQLAQKQQVLTLRSAINLVLLFSSSTSFSVQNTQLNTQVCNGHFSHPEHNNLSLNPLLNSLIPKRQNLVFLFLCPFSEEKEIQKQHIFHRATFGNSPIILRPPHAALNTTGWP